MSDAQAWIFLSVGDAGGNADWAELDRVIGMADSNNHSIPNRDELRRAVRLLTGADLVERDGNRLRLTSRGQALYREVNAERLGHITRFVNLAKVWAETPPPQIAEQVDWPLSHDEWRAAWQTYHERFWEAYRRLEQQRPT